MKTYILSDNVDGIYNMVKDNYIVDKVYKPIYITEEEALMLLDKDINNFKKIKNPTIKVVEKAISIDGMMISYVPRELYSDTICEKAIEQNPFALLLIKKQTDKMKKLAISLDSIVSDYI